MQNAETVLSILSRKAGQAPTFVFDRLYRHLFNPELYLLAYNKLYAKEGNMTPGVDGTTIDGFTLKMIDTLIEEMKRESYTPQPVRRTYIPKKDGRLRPLGIPSVRDKLVQEVVRMLLEALYEPVFTDTSHGFRPGRSCHTALLALKETCKGTNWVIEGDIKGFFDHIDHEKLLDILARRIGDGRFLNLIRKMLRAGYMEFNQVHPSLAGAPQGSTVSPILANIYLNELDHLMKALCQRSNRGANKRRHGPYNTLNVKRRRARRRGDYDLARTCLQQMRTMPSQDPFDATYIRVHYLRYADDFVVMINGSKQLAETLKGEIGQFLQDELHLELSPQKTLITHLGTQRARFLGYEITRASANSQVMETRPGVKTRAANGTIQLLVPAEVIQHKLEPFVRNGKAVHHDARVNTPVLDLLMQYNAEIRGLYQYYSLATDVSRKLGKFRYYHYLSLLKTIARKEQCSVQKVINKYGVEVKHKEHGGTRKIVGVTYPTQEGPKTQTYFDEPLKKRDVPHPGRIAQGIVGMVISTRRQILDRLLAHICELCHYRPTDPREVEVHHVRKLKDIKRAYAKRGKAIPPWVLAMCSMNRKTLVVCKACHRAIHAGHNTYAFPQEKEAKECN